MCLHVVHNYTKIKGLYSRKHDYVIAKLTCVILVIAEINCILITRLISIQ